MSKSQDKVRPWLRDIAIWVDGFRADRRIKRRIREMLARLGNWSKRRARSRRYREDLFPPLRTTNLSEKYELLAAIHNGICEDTWRIKVREPKGNSETATGTFFADIRVYKWSLRLEEVRDEHFNQVLGAVQAVADDLGVKPPKVTRPTTVRTKIKVVNTQTQNVVVVQQSAKRKKTAGSMQTRTRELTERDKEILRTYSDCGRNGSAAAKQLDISRQRVSDVLRKSKALLGRSRSTGVSAKAGRLPTDKRSDDSLSTESGASDKGSGRKRRVKEKF